MKNILALVFTMFVGVMFAQELPTQPQYAFSMPIEAQFAIKLYKTDSTHFKYSIVAFESTDTVIELMEYDGLFPETLADSTIHMFFGYATYGDTPEKRNENMKVVLVMKNKTGIWLDFNSDMLLPDTEEYQFTSNTGIIPNGISTEMWPHMIYALAISDVRVAGSISVDDYLNMTMPSIDAIDMGFITNYGFIGVEDTASFQAFYNKQKQEFQDFDSLNVSDVITMYYDTVKADNELAIADTTGGGHPFYLYLANSSEKSYICNLPLSFAEIIKRAMQDLPASYDSDFLNKKFDDDNALHDYLKPQNKEVVYYVLLGNLLIELGNMGYAKHNFSYGDIVTICNRMEQSQEIQTVFEHL